MNSSKSASVLMIRYNYMERGQKALVVKPQMDNRDAAREVVSRVGLRAPCVFMEELDSVDLSEYACVLVDEAQFLSKAQVEKLVAIVDEKNIPVIAYGLRADFRGELFEGSMWLLAWADVIEETETVCWCGEKATCNARLKDGRVTKDGQQVQLGGNESYISLCRKHWAQGMAGPDGIAEVYSS